MVEAIKVHLKGIALVWLKDEDGEGPLAYPHHVDETGYIKFEHVMSDSYAHVFSDGIIKRYNQVIGTVKDLEGIEYDT